MPLLTVHLSIISEILKEVSNSQLTDNIGVALLGSTAPDRRVMTGEERSETHYFDLDTGKLGDGYEGMKNKHPELIQRTKDQGARAQAFIIGYISHLIADETWIVDVYRPFFGGENYFGNNKLHNIFDRALQYELEILVRQKPEFVLASHNYLDNSDAPVIDESFISREVIESWRKFVLEAVFNRGNSWDEFPRFINRFLDEPDLDREDLEMYLSDPERMLAEIHYGLPDLSVKQYYKDVVDKSLDIIEEIL